MLALHYVALERVWGEQGQVCALSGAWCSWVPSGAQRAAPAAGFGVRCCPVDLSMVVFNFGATPGSKYRGHRAGSPSMPFMHPVSAGALGWAVPFKQCWWDPKGGNTRRLATPEPGGAGGAPKRCVPPPPFARRLLGRSGAELRLFAHPSIRAPWRRSWRSGWADGWGCGKGMRSSNSSSSSSRMRSPPRCPLAAQRCGRWAAKVRPGAAGGSSAPRRSSVSSPGGSSVTWRDSSDSECGGETPPTGPPGETPGREHRTVGPHCPDRIPYALEACSPWLGTARGWRERGAVMEAPSPFAEPAQPLADGGRGPLDSSAGEISGVLPLPCRGLPSSSHPWDPLLAPCGRNPWDPPWLTTMPPSSAQKLSLKTPSQLLAAILPPSKLLQKGAPGCNPPTTLAEGISEPSEQSGKGTRDPPAPGPPPWLCTRLWAAAVVLSHPRCHPHVSPRVMLQAWVSGGGS